MTETVDTFSGLQSVLRKYIERGSTADTDVYAMLPVLINNAERTIATDLNVVGVRKVVTSTMTSGQSVYAKPELWRRTVAINFGSGSSLNQRAPLFARSYDYCRQYWPNEASTDTPKFYADYNDDHFLFTPTPDAAYPFEVTYYAKPTLLSSSNETNWITDNWPQLLMYAALVEIAPFLKEDARLAVWQGAYDKRLSSITEDDLKKIVDRNTTRQEP